MRLPGDQTLWLLVVLLLLLWLLTRERGHRAGNHERRKPLTEDELGRVVFELARTVDLDGFRHLYLSGAEARELLGEAASAYMRPRTRGHWLEEEIVEISARLADQVAYVSTRVDAEHMAWVRVKAATGEERDVPVGRAARVGLIWRLREPVGDWAPYGKATATA